MIETTMQPPVLWLTLSRPQASNAVNEAVNQALVETLREAANRPDVGAVVLAAAGTRAFSAGADLREYSDLPAARAALQRRKFLMATLDALLALPKPIVAAVQAPAVGAGAMLALACDEIIMADTAWMDFPEARLGMPSPVSATMLERRIRWSAMQRLLQAGERCTAGSAVDAGLADACVEPHALAARCQARAGTLAAIPAHAYATNKTWLNLPLRRKLAEAAAHATAHQDGGRPAAPPHH